MKFWLSSGLLLLGNLVVGHAGEIQNVTITHDDGDYSVDLSIKVSGDKDTIYGIATDYKRLSRLSDVIIESGLISRDDGKGSSIVRRRIVTRACVLRFCFDTILIEDIWEPESGIIKTVFVPEDSDFLYGEAVWQVQRLDDSNTLIRFTSTFRQDFWVPPLIGTMVIKRMALNTAEYTIKNIETIAASEQTRP